MGFVCYGVWALWVNSRVLLLFGVILRLNLVYLCSWGVSCCCT